MQRAWTRGLKQTAVALICCGGLLGGGLANSTEATPPPTASGSQTQPAIAAGQGKAPFTGLTCPPNTSYANFGENADLMLRMSYTGGDGSRYEAQEVPSNVLFGVRGLTASIPAGNFTGDGEIPVHITGTPHLWGGAHFVLEIGGRRCEFFTVVRFKPGPVAAMTCPSNYAAAVNGQAYNGTRNLSYIAGDGSAYEAQSIPSKGVEGLVATIAKGDLADGNGQLRVDVRGTPTTQGVANFEVPFGGKQCTFSMDVTSSTPPISDLQCPTTFPVAVDGQTYTNTRFLQYKGGIGATYEGQVLESTGVLGLTARITGGNFSHDNNIAVAVTGRPIKGGMAKFNVALGERHCAIEIPVGVRDRNYGVETEGKREHQFIYVPVLAEDGRIWLKHNLGANYANENHPAFNPAATISAPEDYNAYGSSFEWGRFSDGHELVRRLSATEAVPVHGYTDELATTDTPNHPLYIRNGGRHRDWRSPSNANLWKQGLNDPCPVGYRVPTKEEWTRFIIAAGAGNIAGVVHNALGLTLAGMRTNAAGIADVGAAGAYWSSSGSINYELESRNKSYRFYFDYPTQQPEQPFYRSFGHSVRCIQDLN